MAINVLLVEDNPSDQLLTQEALKDSKLKLDLHIVEDGVEALDFLRHADKFKFSPKPDLILLDLNLPKMNGQEVLKEIKIDKNLKDIPVVVMTTSTSEGDIVKSYGLHCNCYVTKPLDFGRFIEIVRNLENFWFTIVRLPRKS